MKTAVMTDENSGISREYADSHNIFHKTYILYFFSILSHQGETVERQLFSFEMKR